MGNILYWNIGVITPESKTYYALTTENLNNIAEYKVNKEKDKWDNISPWIFPYYIQLEADNSDYIYPRLTLLSYKGFILNLLLALCIFFLRRTTKKEKLFDSIFVLITGIAGLLSIIILPKFRN